jgi:hypothetical protein
MHIVIFDTHIYISMYTNANRLPPRTVAALHVQTFPT